MSTTTLPAVINNVTAAKEDTAIANLKSDADILQNKFTFNDAVRVVNEGKITEGKLENVVQERDKAENSKRRWYGVALKSGVVMGLCALATEKAPTPKVATVFLVGAGVSGAIAATAMAVATKAGNKLQETNDFLLTLAGKKKQKD